ncbi:MAG: phosphomannose isomerase type II C-terminal cupin domain [Candidatus Doudnabacteria bacterium]|nr:phosphomannose isomerase type II C-terminal cupin domain [Candidatus Doudnabacteria bacterium]
MSKNVRQFEERPWGSFEVLGDFQVENQFGPDVVVKKMTIRPGKRLSYQFHKLRREYSVVVSGTGFLTVNGKDIPVSAGSFTEVKVGEKHRMTNDGTQDLIYIEVGMGEFDEFDNIRLEDDYGRAKV